MIGLIRSLFYRPPLLQVAALCWRKTDSDLQILLVRSLDSNRWILPKGWPMRGKSLAEAAAQEAWEEAGVKGATTPTAIGRYGSRKRRGSGVKQPAQIEVFALEVEDSETQFPEADLRKTRWFPAQRAIKKLRHPELGALILRHLGPDAGSTL